MIKYFYTLLTILAFSTLNAQTVDFENFGLTTDMFLNGDDLAGGFDAGDLFLPNDYNTNYDSWSGWAISSTTDVTTAGFTNQYSCIAGTGFESSVHYAVTYSIGNSVISYDEGLDYKGYKGLYINNSTYTYLSMLNGDSFAKKFGGVDGTDPDFYSVTFKDAKDPNGPTVEFFLADFRSDDSTEDYIIDEWTFVDLSSLGDINELEMTLASSDVGQFGINTPTYFCIDEVELNLSSDSKNLLVPAINSYPNPCVDFISIEHSAIANGKGSIIDVQGNRVKAFDLNSSETRLDVSNLSSGLYVIQLKGIDGTAMNSFFVKH